MDDENRKMPAPENRDEFVQLYSGIYEHSPWVAEEVFGLDGTEVLSGMQSAMQEVVNEATRERQHALICAHPDLGISKAEASSLTAASTSEQTGAGLMQCSTEEFAEFQRLNAAYKEKFGFPFIIAVKGLSRVDILEAFRTRIESEKEVEFCEALRQIHRIAYFRLVELAK